MEFLTRFLPQLCELCRAPASALLCPDCRASLPVYHQACATCGLPLARDATVCGDCLAHPKPFTRCCSPLRYQHPVDRLLLAMKARPPHRILRQLGPLLTARLDDFYRDDTSTPSLLVPVPSHWRKRLVRGFNQAAALAYWLAHQRDLPVTECLVMSRLPNDQKRLDRAHRLRNLHGVYSCQQRLDGLHLALVDDVVTTCATTTAATRALLRAGASRVDVWALARTPL